MKKYVITEAQLKTIVEKYEPVPPDVADAAPIGFQAFMYALKHDNVANQTDSNNKGDLKNYVATKMASSRAQDSIDKANSALDNIAADHSKTTNYTRSYTFKDDNTLAKAEDLTVIILSLLYYFYKEGQIDHNIKNNKDINMDYNTIYNGVKKHGVHDFKWMTNIKLFANWRIWVDPNDDTQSIVSSENGTVQVYIDNNTTKTRLVRFSNISTKTLTKFYSDVLRLNNPSIIDLIGQAIKNQITAKINSSSLEFTFK